MSSSMKNFMEAYAAVHNKEAKEEFYASRDFITEMDLSSLLHTDLVDIAEKVVSKLFETYTVAQTKSIISNSFTGVPSVQEHKVSRLIEAFQTVFHTVAETAPTLARESFQKYLHKKGLEQNKSVMNSVDESHARFHRHAVAGDIQNVQALLLQLFEKKAAKDYDGDGKVESGKDEYFGSRDKAIKKAMGKKNPAAKEEALRKADDLAGSPMKEEHCGDDMDDDDDKKKKGKKQGYNDRLDDSLGAKNGKKKQSMKDRRDESEGEEKSKGKRKFSGDKSMDEKYDYSAKKAAAGKDIGKPGKNFAKIADKAGKKYGSKEAGKRVAGAILAKMRKEGTEFNFDESFDGLVKLGLSEDQALWALANYPDIL